VVISFTTTAPYTANSNNTFLGNHAGAGNTSAFNTFIGTNAGQFDINGHGNMYIGFNTGPASNSINPVHYAVIALGSNAMVSNALTQNAIALGSATSAVSNQIKLGDNTLTTFKVGSVAQWPTPSDQHLKSDIHDAKRSMSFIRGLKPVLYEMNDHSMTRLGFIAQDVEKTDAHFPGLVRPAVKGDFYALNYEAFLPAIASSIQEIDDRLKKLEETSFSRKTSNQSSATIPHPPYPDPFKRLETLVAMINSLFGLIACVGVILIYLLSKIIRCQLDI
jgi:hypothetical protein